MSAASLLRFTALHRSKNVPRQPPVRSISTPAIAISRSVPHSAPTPLHVPIVRAPTTQWMPQRRYTTDDSGLPKVLLPKDVDWNKLIYMEPKKTSKGGTWITIQYDGIQGGYLRIQTPTLRIPFNPQESMLPHLRKDSKDTVTLPRLPLAIDDWLDAGEGKEFMDTIRSMEDHVVEHAQKSSWFLTSEGKSKPLMPEVIRYNFRSTVREPKDDKFWPIISFKFQTDAAGTPRFNVFNKEKQPISYADLKKGDKVKAIISPHNVWIVSASGWGVAWKVLQVKVEESAPRGQGLDDYSFVE